MWLAEDKKNPKSSQPQGMGLEPGGSSKKQGSASEGVKKAAKNSERGKKASEGARKASEGASRTAKGAAQASQGAGRVAAGDLSGAKDVAKGAVDTAKGAKQTLDGVKDLKDAASKDDKADLKDMDLDDMAKGSQLDDPYNAANYKSLFDDDEPESKDSLFDEKDKDDKDDKDDSDSDTDDGEGKGMKDLLSDDDDDDESDSDSLHNNDSGEDDEDINFKDLAKKASQLEALKTAMSSYAAFQALMRFLEMLYFLAQKAAALVASVWASITGFFSSIGTALVNGAAAVGSFLGTSTAVAGAMLAGVGTTLITVTVVVVTPIVTNQNQRMDETLVCNPSSTSISDSTLEWADGELSAMKRDSIQKAWSVFSEMGVSREVAAGILGNFAAESGVDPTAVETIGNEPYHIGPRKQHAIDSGFRVEAIDAAYGNRFPGVKIVGIGLGQWSNTRNPMLLDYAADRGLDWFDIGTQLAFMFDADSGKDTLWSIVNTPDITVTQAMEDFLDKWEIPAASERERSYQHRLDEALKIALELEIMEVDVDYAQSIISQMNADAAEGNHRRSAYFKDDGCGDTVGSHVGAPDGTGVFPASVTGTMWTPETLPSELRQFTYDPADVGMAYAGTSGWIVNGFEGQCVALSQSYMAKLYGVDYFRGYDGGDVAKGWYANYGDTLGGELSKVPQAGAVFEYMNSGIYGHTGVVQHVFANGDLMVVEQNIAGISGDNNGTPRTWGWRYIPASEYQNDTSRTRDWQFYKPDREPNWSGA